MGLFDESPFEQLTGRKSPLEVRFPSFSKKAGEFGKTAGMMPVFGGVRTIAPGIATMPKTASWFSKISLPSLTTTAKVAAGGTILYGGYKASESLGRFTETGSFTKKDIKTGAIDVPGTPPGLSGLNIPAGSPVILNLPPNEYPGTGSFFGDIGAGLGRGAGETGKGVGSGLEMAIPVLAIGGLAYILLKEKNGHKK